MPHFKTAVANSFFLSSSGKFNLAFRLGGDAVAGRWTEPPAVERGKAAPSLEVLVLLSDRFHRSVDWILRGEGH